MYNRHRPFEQCEEDVGVGRRRRQNVVRRLRAHPFRHRRDVQSSEPAQRQSFLH